MGIFDFLGNQAPTHLSETEAFVAISIAMIAADGEVNEEELVVMTSYLMRMKIYRNENEKSMQAMYDKAMKIIKEQGMGALVAAANQALPAQLKPAAFACAIDLAMADGEVAESEKQLIQEMQRILAVDDETTNVLVQAMTIKNSV